MPVTSDQPGPYAPASAILELVTRHRNKGLPSPVDGEVLGRAGISDSLIPRTLQALRTLDLIDEDGNPTAVLEGIRMAREDEYQERLKEWLTSAYADVLQYVDPANATDSDIRDAFRSYKPIGQQPRMVTLFSGLFRAAGVGPDKPVPSSRKSGGPASEQKSKSKFKLKRKKKDPETPSGAAFSNNELPPVLSGLLASLPKDGKTWTVAERDAFLKTFSAVLDFCYTPVENIKAPEPNDAEDDEIDE
ncbi:DUF5343 domain-containing protein [Hyphococcus sp.]|uniref:DUF5343 domain-containing protein n=1 Tax=Hyphococcus sp. TaxID=2038636 RepID=UPI0035C66373